MVGHLHTPPQGGKDTGARLFLAPGAMGAMDTPVLEELSGLLAARGIDVMRFEFAYMATRRTDGTRRPPPRAEKLLDEYREAVKELGGAGRRIFIGGKSLGGRVASLVAGEMHARGEVDGLVCFGYPFHPPKRPDKLRTAHLAVLACPALVIQGERDPFGRRAEVTDYELADAISVRWAIDGDHDLKPRKASGRSHTDNLAEAADAVAAFITTQVTSGR